MAIDEIKEICPKCKKKEVLYSYPYGQDEPPSCWECTNQICIYMNSMFDYGTPSDYRMQTLAEFYKGRVESMAIEFDGERRQLEKKIRTLEWLLVSMKALNLDIYEYLANEEIRNEKKRNLSKVIDELLYVKE